MVKDGLCLFAENTYLSWIKQFILYHGKHRFGCVLTYLATQQQVSASTQNKIINVSLVTGNQAT